MTVNLNRAFAGEDPEFMSRLFPEGGWRENLALSKGKNSDWSWFWNKFAPNGMLMSEDPPGRRIKPMREMSTAIMKAVVLGFIESEEPAAKYDSDGCVLHYWPLLKKDPPNDLFEYSNAVAEGAEA